MVLAPVFYYQTAAYQAQSTSTLRHQTSALVQQKLGEGYSHLPLFKIFKAIKAGIGAQSTSTLRPQTLTAHVPLSLY
jgi:hypothetical protein